jgi:thymidine phosphorylase
MNEPLASASGNGVEVAYIVDYLTGRRREARFHEVNVELCAEMLVLGRLTDSVAEARARIEDAIASGKAAEIFQRMVVALGGPSDLLERPAQHLKAAPVVRPVHAEVAGVVRKIATRDIGLAVVALGGGRTRPQDPVDHAVGLTELPGIGEKVDGGRPLCIVHARSEDAAEAAARTVRRAYFIGDGEGQSGPLILERIGAAA